MTFSTSVLVGSFSSNPEKVSLSCGLDLLLLNSSLSESCDLSLNSFSKTEDLVLISSQKYFQLCTSNCRETLETLSVGLGNKNCAGEELAANLNSTLLKTYVDLATSILCIKTKDGNGYCLKQQLPSLLPVIESIKGVWSALSILFRNRNVLCTDCMKSELETMKPLPLTGINPQIQSGIRALVNNFNLVCPFGLDTVTAPAFIFVPKILTTTTTTTKVQVVLSPTMVAKSSSLATSASQLLMAVILALL